MKIFPILFLLSFSALAEVMTFGVVADAGNWDHNSRKVRDSLIKSKIKSLILPGDNIYKTVLKYEDVWKPWTDVGLEFSVVAIGNHIRSYQEEVAFFKMPGEYYSKVIGESRFIVLNSDNQNTVTEQAKFLAKELESAHEQFIFVVYHHLPFTIRHGWQEREKFQLATRPIMLKHQKKITALLAGHDHVAAYIEMASLPVIVSGAVFESFLIEPVDYQEFGVRVKTHWTSRGGYYWTRLDVNEDLGEVWVNYVRADQDRVDCSVRIAPRPVFFRPNCGTQKR